MQVEIVEQVFDPWRRLSEYQPGRTPQASRAGEFGAVSVFVGTMRDFNQGDEVKMMRLEHYPEMTRAYIESAIGHAADEYAIGDALVVHRVGEILPGEAIVLVAVWAAHRRDAYAVNRRIMEALKSGAPFWKREVLNDDTRWVRENTPG